jgi:4a-hydroxytetrahydrobiopterin dehydratase
MARLNPQEARERVKALPGWELLASELEIRKVYVFSDFKGSMLFVNRVAELAEAMDHHPDILISYRRVTLTLTSHDSGGLTDRDFRLAGRIDG